MENLKSTSKIVNYNDNEYFCYECINNYGERVVIVEFNNEIITTIKNLLMPLDVFDYEYFDSIVIERIKCNEQLNRLICK